MNIKGIIENFLHYKCLLKELVSRDFKLKYRRSVLGYAWSLLNPLLTMVVMNAVFSNFFKYSIENFPIYFLLGQIMWGFYSDSTSAAMTSIFTNSELIKKVYVPKYMFPLSKTCFGIINMFCSLGAVIIVMIFKRVSVSQTMILLPILLMYAFFIALGMGLILSVIAVYFRDMMHLYGIVLTIQMYLTPIFYPVEILPPTVYSIIQFNPVYHLVTYFRKIALYGTWPTVEDNLICLGFGLVLNIIGIWVFKRHQKKFILYV